MNHKYLQQFVWIMVIFLSSCNYQKSIQSFSEMQDNLYPKKNYISSTNLAASQNIKELEKNTFTLINQYRQSKNLPALQWNNDIVQQSRIHAQQMASGKTTFSHDGFKKRVEIISQKIPYKGAAENIASNQGYGDPAEAAVKGWLKSPGHYKNIVGDYNLTAIGIAQNSQGMYYFNQLFIKTR